MCEICERQKVSFSVDSSPPLGREELTQNHGFSVASRKRSAGKRMKLPKILFHENGGPLAERERMNGNIISYQVGLSLVRRCQR
jgi:hypothetical protein